MTPKTQIRIGQLVAIVMAVVSLLNTLIVLGITRHNFSDHAVYVLVLQDLVRPIALSNVLGIVWCASFFLALWHRFFKISLFLLIVYTVLVVRSLFSLGYSDMGDISIAVFELLTVLVLCQGVIGVRREKLKQSVKAGGAGNR